MKLFGTDGIRGHVGNFLTAPLALQIGYAAGKTLGGKSVLIGQDSRNSSDMLSAALSAGLTAAGLDVRHLGLCPTPAIAYLTAKHPDLTLGIMVSASHNPPEDNGIKFFGADGLKISREVQQTIEMALGHEALVQPAPHWGKWVGQESWLQDYQQSIQQSISGDLSGIKVVLDLAWGSAVSVAAQVFRALGAEVITLHDRADGDRINVNCGSTDLQALQDTVVAAGADLGFAFDGDADRVIAVDRLGKAVNGDYILYLWGKTLLAENRLPDSTIVTTVMANLAFEKAWQRQGGNLVRTSVGDQYVQAEMLRSGSMLGGEQSGHVLCRHYSISGDGLLAAVHLTALVKQEAPLNVLLKESFVPYPQILQNIRVEERARRLGWESCDPVTQTIERAKQDLGDRGRVLVRASGTEPVLRVMVEAETPELTHHWVQTVSQSITEYI